MNGLRSKTQQPSDRSSLDALNRTIEGLEARIEGLMSQKFPRDPRAASTQPEPKSEAYAAPREPRAAVTPPQLDPVNEIRQRQRLLETSFQRPQEPAARPERTISRPLAPNYRQREPQQAAAAAPRARAIPPYQEQQRNDAALQEIAQALVNLRHELKHDITEGVAREAQGLRAEIRNIRAVAEDQQFIGDLRDDIARLAGSIDQLGNLASPDAYGLRNEFEDLRLTIDQLAREDSVHRIESRWNNVEDTLRGFDAGALQDEIVSLAYRLDDIKSQLGGMSNNPAVRVLEDKLITIASAVEQLGKHMQPNEAAFSEQFSGLDQRLDEISRAIAATGTRANAQATDNALAQRLENRLNGLAEQLGDINRLAAAKPEPTLDLTARLEALAGKIDELSTARDAAQLHERLDQLSLLLERSQRPSQQAELTSFLSDISRKIDALDHGAVNDGLAERLDTLSRRIEDLDYRYSQPQPAAGLSESAFSRLEERLGTIAARLDETAHAAPADSHALASLENQIAHLSTLISQPVHTQASLSPELDARMAAIEDYMASNDEYIIEAARQAAEAVLDAYTRNNLSAGANLADMSMLTDLATDLRNLEALSRNTEERTHRTFEALHETLVQIAGRLDSLDNAPAYREEAAPRTVAQSMVTPAREEVAMPAAIFPEEGYIAEEQAILDDPRENDAATIVPPAAAKPAKTEKKSLLAGLTKRFKTGTAKTAQTVDEPVAAASTRTQVEPAPSLDPIDVLPAGQENELLEPGSGAPDIKKILERVRASQVAASGKAADAEGRTDFIAAARRAAQAAAMETSPEKLETGKKSRKAEGLALSRYRRPLLLGIGAILLAMMAMPLVKTLIGGAEAPAPVIEQKMDNGPVSALPETGDKAVTIPSDLAIDPEQAASADSIENAAPAQNTIDPRTVGGAPLPEEPPVADVPAVDAAKSDTVAQSEGPKPAEVTTTAVPAQDTIAVPAGIEPASLAEAAAKGDTQALFEIAARYTDGRGVTADRAEAAKWYKLAADRGLAPAQYRLANLYEKANGVERNLPEAKRYYTLAAEQGNAGAMHNLAVLLASDAAGQPDFASAAQWFIKASELGVRDSQFNLAILYARGSGVKQDIEESYKWFAIAAKDGDADAAQKRDEVAGAMNPQQLQSARARVDAWKAKPLSEDANSVNTPEEWAGKEGVKTASVDMEKAIRNIQAILNKNGFDAGQPDGKLGKNTVTAIKDFQKSVGQTPDGRITNELVTALLARNK
ncbi:cell division protein PodJ [Agrobacterium sp. NPDC089420]|uniref:cell division protein PodJ n=1 Tax=Agrobacterium sp. NPDC089420 TaxID=3363918 RepID=UPI00384AB9C0